MSRGPRDGIASSLKLLNLLYTAEIVADLVSTLPGSYSLMVMQKAVYDRDHARMDLGCGATGDRGRNRAGQSCRQNGSTPPQPESIDSEGRVRAERGAGCFQPADLVNRIRRGAVTP